MSGIRHSLSARQIALSFVVLALSACDADDEPQPARPRSYRLLVASLPPDGAAPVPKAVLEALSEARNSRAKLAPRLFPAGRIAFTKGGVAQLGADELLVRRLPDLGVIAKRSVAAARVLVPLSDGTLLIVSGEQTYALAPGATKLRPLPRLTVFPGSYVFADRRYASQLWILEGFGSSLVRYQLDAPDGGGLELASFGELNEFDERGFAVLKDGSFLYTTGDGFRRCLSFSCRTRLKSSVATTGNVRMFSARRLDRVWVFTPGDHLVLLELGAAARPLRELTLPSGVFDLDIDDDRIALVRAVEKPGAPRAWELCVLDENANLQFTAPLPSEPASGSDPRWVDTVTANKSVVLSRYGPELAVGGPTWLHVWNGETGQELK